jgi:2-methylisocitrate lyase-like PEP mutase family enzyme
VGFDFLYLAGSGATGSFCGEPDLSVMTQTEFAKLGEMIATNTDLPVIADAGMLQALFWYLFKAGIIHH